MRSKRSIFIVALATLLTGGGFYFNYSQGQRLHLTHPAFATSVEGNVTQVFVSVSRKLMPSVVNIFTTATVRSPWGRGGPDDLWRRFFEDFFGEPGEGGPGGIPHGVPPGVPPGGPFGGKAPKSMSLGSGFVIEKVPGGGLVLTNNHVVEAADEIKIKFTETADEKESEAEVIGRDPDLDIALLKVTTTRQLQPLVLGNSDALEVGEWIGAMGNPFGHGHTFTHGIVSAKERSLPGSFSNYLQVDAPINPGNSGGPLANLNGEVVGINNAIDARGPGIGFAIPINLVKAVLPQLKEKGIVERGYIGVSVDELRPDLAKQLKLDVGRKAPIVTNIMPGHPAAKAGIQVYDVILEVNGKPVYSAQELVGAITAVPIGQKAKLKVARSGKEKVFDVLVAKRPDFKAERRLPREKEQKKKFRGVRIDTGMQLEAIDPGIAQELGLSPKFKGVVVSRVDPDGPAYLAGLGRGDVILEVDRKPVRTEEDFYNVVKAKKTYLVRVRKQDESGREAFVVLTLNLSNEE